ncbi:MAG: sodium:calcium antiporter, partial [Gemmatimonadota bacterium]
RRRGIGRLWLRFALLAPVLAGTGWLIAQAGVSLSIRTGLSQTVVGALITAVATSLPELVAAIAAVRQGALTLAVGDVIGGNIFDTLFVAAADVAYRPGSIYHAVPDRVVFLIALTILLTGISLLGFLRREERGIAGIGFESFLILVAFLGGYLLLFLV